MNIFKTIWWNITIFYYQKIYNPIYNWREQRWSKRYWKNRCAHCGGDGTVDIGDYGQSYVVTCDACNGTGKKQNINEL